MDWVVDFSIFRAGKWISDGAFLYMHLHDVLLNSRSIVCTKNDKFAQQYCFTKMTNLGLV